MAACWASRRPLSRGPGLPTPTWCYRDKECAGAKGEALQGWRNRSAFTEKMIGQARIVRHEAT